MRHPFLLQRLLELVFVFEVVLLLDVLDDALELLVAEREPELASALDQQQLVDGVENELRRYFSDRLSEFGTVGVTFASSGRVRNTETCRCSNSVFVRMSPFTLTSTCSMICAPTGTEAMTAAKSTGIIRFSIDNSCRINILTQRTKQSFQPLEQPPSARGSFSGCCRMSSFVKPWSRFLRSHGPSTSSIAPLLGRLRASGYLATGSSLTTDSSPATVAGDL